MFSAKTIQNLIKQSREDQELLKVLLERSCKTTAMLEKVGISPASPKGESTKVIKINAKVSARRKQFLDKKQKIS